MNLLKPEESHPCKRDAMSAFPHNKLKVSESPVAIADGVSIIILTRNRLVQLRAVLALLLPQLRMGDEVVIVDTGSSDGTRKWIERLPPPCKPILNDLPEFDFAQARNCAIEHVRNEFVAFLDDDCIPTPDWLTRLRVLLRSFDAVGGIILPYSLYRYPRWWSGNIAWTTGMTPSGVLAGQDDNYPATANMGMRREALEQIPFTPISEQRSSSELYLSGREDADWWLRARRHGLRLHIESSLVVYHFVPSERFFLRNVLRRSRFDGLAASQRQHSEQLEKFEEQVFTDLAAHIVAHPIETLHRGIDHVASTLVWLHRQFFFLSGRSENSKKLLWLISRVAPLACRKKAGELRLKLVLKTRPAFRIPETPNHMLIAAPTYLGDTVLLLPVIELLTRNWPEANVVVWTRFPELFEKNSPMVTILGPSPLDEQLAANFALWGSQISFVPYYHFGNSALWRRAISLRAVTFTHDVGFSKVADYFYAPVRKEKRFDQHEVLNLLELFSQWPLAGSLTPPRLTVPEEVFRRIARKHPALLEAPYVTLHIDTALPMKQWPLDRWEYAAKAIHSETGANCVFIGTIDAAERARELVERLGKWAVNLCGLSLSELIAVLGYAKMAIGPCSGPKHLAYALRIPTFTLYGAVSETRWGAWFDRPIHAYVTSPISYLSPREQTGLPENHAMLLIDAVTVAEKIIWHYRSLENSQTSL